MNDALDAPEGPAVPTDAELTRLVDDQRRADRLRDRRAARQRDATDEDSATFGGALRDLAESGRRVTVVGAGGSVTGRITELARDFVTVEQGRLRVHLALTSVAAAMAADVAMDPAGSPPRHRPEPFATRGMAGLLRELVERRAQVTVHLGVPVAPVVGTAGACGDDVLTVQVDRPGGQSVMVWWPQVHRIDERR